MKFHPFRFGRPKDDALYPIPIALLQPEFARFQEDLRSVSPDPSLSPLAWRWLWELSPLFETESIREELFHKLLAPLFGEGIVIQKTNVGSYSTDGGVLHAGLMSLPTMPVLIKVKNETTEGSSDAVFELLLYYKEGVRLVLTQDAHKDARRTRLPSILILHNGPNVQIYGAVWLAEGYIEVLSASIPLYFSLHNKWAMEDLLRFMTALRYLYQSLALIYRNPLDHSVDPDQVEFPYPRYYPAGIHHDEGLDSKGRVSFSYIKRISSIRLVFSARTEHGEDIIVKFGDGSYGVEGHQAAARADLAPTLLSHSRLPGRMWMVVMSLLPEGFKSCGSYAQLPGPCKMVITKAVTQFHELGYVHGDLRDANVFVRDGGEAGEWKCALIDFDWAGRPGEATYPPGVFNNDAVWRPHKYMDGKLITADDDLQTITEFFDRR